ncbi:hypothetical protein VB713_24850 [Anabaena cylindrica UHCC 0172]|uniref:hypothetical protein n=1 Tax=Anabaena cylindrica TaxID=1165 RepID=UPI002B1FBDB1|nr:hypothetical protein [Anabaena cylindrica]MEA5554168.1 hypothetical protein [Anabaena cylindrica UHCC 0172]
MIKLIRVIKLRELWDCKIPKECDCAELGLTLWAGVFEGKQDIWLRWCEKAGNILPTGTESV